MRRILLVTAIVFTALAGAFAQGVTTASISGTVTNQEGETLPGANIIAVHVSSGTEYGTSTRTDGKFNLPNVRVGSYNITVSFVGFQSQKKENVNLSLGQNYTIDFKLGEEATTLSEVQIVGQEDPVLNAERTGAATNVRREQFETLPTISRNFQDLTALDPRAGSSNLSFGGRSNLYNNLTIDGSTSNNVFGLSATPGGQTNTQPISVDAIEDMQVSIAPYDVRQGAFTGAGVNLVTRSGTNEFTGSVYGFYRNQDFVGKKIEGNKIEPSEFNYKNYGIRLGGPILKNKLFFFVNAELEEHITPAVTFPVNTSGNQATAITNVNDPNYNSPTNLERLRTFLLDPAKGWTFDPGSYENFDATVHSTKFLAKVDWNINTKHKLTVRYNQLDSYRDIPPSNSGGIGSAPQGGRQNSVNAIPFSKSFYRQNNNLKSIIAELNSNFSSKYSNTFTIGYSAFRDFREQGGGGTPPNFPTVDILGPNGSTLTTFGPDPFTPNNKLDQTIIQVNDNFSIFLNKHIVTVGTANEFFKFNNVFTQQINGVYLYSSIDNFINNVTAPTTIPSSNSNAPSQYLLQYSAIEGNPAPGAEWNAAQLGFYAQDEYSGFKNLTLTLGFRVDVPIFSTDLPQNPVSDEMTFVNGQRIRVGRLPKTSPLYSPRIGVNWDVLGDKTLQVRGGTGVFTGRVPFVWISNQVGNNGLLFGSIIASNQDAGASYPFNPVPLTSSGTAPQFAINAAVEEFKFPQVWRTNIAVDKALPFGIVGTLEGIYTKDINAVYIKDANLNNPYSTIEGDGRPLFPATLAPNPTNPALPGRRVNQNITQALLLDNSDKGYQWSLTGQLQKTFAKGLYASVAYTFTEAQDVNSQTASTASSIFTGYPIVESPNKPVLSYSSNLTRHRIVASASYRKEYAKYFGSSLSLIYTGYSGNTFSYTYSGDLNNDGLSNDLIYIPRSKDEILLTTSDARDTRTPDQIWEQLDNYIKQDKYLSEHRGEYAERNGASAPWVHNVNLRFLQDFFIETGKGKRNTLQLSVELINALNLFNSDWGLFKTPARSSLLTFVGYENPAATSANTNSNNPLLPNNSYMNSPASGRPIFSFATNSNGTPLTESFVNSTGLNQSTFNSRWQLQFGIRYIFN
ncbi:TonB-dependent receptor [Chryseosolibacter indicus]|uniref:Carboxypeptidase regulatory-like domain-containing protein n=1 Tax=Chryseosolibacter indicus TaxID=2782351 RepID=A0ABS5VPB8_9BACT|nr:carboxypeptidase regulatory-like domain-containing protein [Chryseosolibacter indicus]MBT1703001.1 carboxypeptidase regulatory-like domain-containing protein [Chryseosolibacter indicus]